MNLILYVLVWVNVVFSGLNLYAYSHSEHAFNLSWGIIFGFLYLGALITLYRPRP